jgi:hypothetical protein
VRLTADGKLLDGRSRLDALEMIGVPTVTAAGKLAAVVTSVVEEGDPYDIALSLNVKRRHLTTAKKRSTVVELLKQRPERSDRLTAKLAGVDHKTVARLRKELVASGEIPQLDERVGQDQKTRVIASDAHPPTVPISLGAYALCAVGVPVLRAGRRVLPLSPASTSVSADVALAL